MNIGKARAIKARALFAQVASGEYHGSTVGEYLEAVKIVLDMETHNTISKKMIISVCKWLVEIAEKAVSPYRWIPVSERLPEVHESGNSVSGIYMQSNPVLVYGTCEYEDNAQFHVVTYCDDLDGNTYWSTELDAITVSGVIAWMPLPEAYKPNK